MTHPRSRDAVARRGPVETSGALHAVLVLSWALCSAAGELDDYLTMPDGFMYHKSCVHHHIEHFEVERLPEGRGTHVVGGDSFGPCPFDRVPAKAVLASTGPENLKYYSDWSVYAQTAGPKYNFMTSTWQVPPAPKSRGPLGLSSVYLFNGLEDGGGVHGKASLILQPVLLFGKSGCVLNPADWGQWNLQSYLVDGNGRAHCGKRIKVHPGQTVIGTMQQQQGNNTWLVESIAVGENGAPNQTSSYVGDLADKYINSAYVTLEGMVIYNCATYPPNNGVTFKEVLVGTAAGGVVAKTSWTSMVRHSECNQRTVESDNGRDVTLLWNSTLTV